MNQYQHEITVDYSPVDFKRQTLMRQLKLLQRDHKGLKRQLQSLQQERETLLQELRSFQQKQQEFLSQDFSTQREDLRAEFIEKLQAFWEQHQALKIQPQLQSQFSNLQQQQVKLCHQLERQTQQIEQINVLLESCFQVVQTDHFLSFESLGTLVQKDRLIQQEDLENELSFALQLATERQQWANWEQELMMKWQEEKLQWQAREEKLKRKIAEIQQQYQTVNQYLHKNSQLVELKVSEQMRIQVLVPIQQPALLDLLKPLKILLQSQQWQKADEETFRLLLQISQRQEQQWLDQEALTAIPKVLWQAINQLWLEASQQRFGLSIQQRIWRSLGGSGNADERVRQVFGDRIGWRKEHQWLQLAALPPSLAAPIGQFPALGLQMGGLSWPIEGFGYIKRQAFEFFLSKIDFLDE